jgi:orotate phosphoribosyltransferase
MTIRGSAYTRVFGQSQAWKREFLRTDEARLSLAGDTPTSTVANRWSDWVTDDDVLAEFRAAEALLEGHFILSSGRRSRIFLQKMLVFQDPVRTERLCRALAERITTRFGKVDVVVSPAMGGVIPGYETARALGCRAIFVEREEGTFQLRRNFSVRAGDRIVMVEDLVTTGVSSRECLAALRMHPGEVLGAACLIDRSNGRADVGVPLVALARLDVPDFDANDLPAELAAIPAVKPGSRAL